VDCQLGLQARDRLACLLALGLNLFDGRRQFVWQHRQRADTASHGVAIDAQHPQRPAAAHEREPGAAAELLCSDDRNQPDFTCSRHVRAAAGGEIEIGDLDQSQRPLAHRLLAERQLGRLFGRGESDGDRPVLPDDAVRFVDASLDVCRRNFLGEVDRRGLPAHMEAHGSVVEHALEGRRQHMLSGVLLHVVETARPVDLAVYRLADCRHVRRDLPDGSGRGYVQHALAIVDGVDHVDRSQTADVEGLPTGCRIERRAIEDERRCAFVLDDLEDDGVE
jgi:hypothetical protein